MMEYWMIVEAFPHLSSSTRRQFQEADRGRNYGYQFFHVYVLVTSLLFILNGTSTTKRCRYPSIVAYQNPKL
jgi:hypothetical protein